MQATRYFNVADLLYDSLTSVSRACDEVRIYDARYPEFKCSLCGREHDNSCDNTMEEIEAFERDNPSLTVHVQQWPAQGEMEKRSKMMQDVAEGDCILVIDDDELFFGDATPLWQFCGAPPSKFAYIDFLFAQAGHGTGAPIPLARLFVKTPGLRYERNYYTVIDDGGLVVDMKADNKMVPYGYRTSNRTYIHPSARIVELWNYRTKKRGAGQNAYNNIVSKRDWGNH